MEEKNSLSPKTGSLRKLITSRTFLKSLLGIVAGGLAGFLFFWFVGCNSGTCPITSNPYYSILTGSMMGLVITT